MAAGLRLLAALAAVSPVDFRPAAAAGKLYGRLIPATRACAATHPGATADGLAVMLMLLPDCVSAAVADSERQLAESAALRTRRETRSSIARSSIAPGAGRNSTTQLQRGPSLAEAREAAAQTQKAVETVVVPAVAEAAATLLAGEQAPGGAGRGRGLTAALSLVVSVLGRKWPPGQKAAAAAGHGFRLAGNPRPVMLRLR